MEYEKKYKQALERARECLKDGTISSKAIAYIEDIFPELKEIEDERIRKAIHIYLDWLDGRKDYAPKGIYSIKDMIAWLEKQGEQTTDKIESKFKVGDWVVLENIGTYKVIEVCESWYEVIDNQNNHYSIGFDKEDMCHLWTINDAKDGDESMTVYCYLARDWRFETKKELCFDKNPYNTNPATKKQRDLLFKKIKEAGYKWDSVKKELKKPKKLDPDKVIEWMKTHGNLWPHVTIKINEVIDKFKEDFGL